MKCHHCDGTGILNITVHEGPTVENVTLDCVFCNKTGELTQEQLDEENNFWCKCGNKSGITMFYEDGEHPEVTKHHVRCGDCLKVTQVG